MPIRPENKNRYPKNWDDIRRQILVRAQNKCEGSPQYPECRAINGQPHPITESRVVLTIAHYPDPTPENCELDNLRALCQRCHNTLDARLRAQHAAETRRAKKITRQQAIGQQQLPFEEVPLDL